MVSTSASASQGQSTAVLATRSDDLEERRCQGHLHHKVHRSDMVSSIWSTRLHATRFNVCSTEAAQEKMMSHKNSLSRKRGTLGTKRGTPDYANHGDDRHLAVTLEANLLGAKTWRTRAGNPTAH